MSNQAELREKIAKAIRKAEGQGCAAWKSTDAMREALSAIDALLALVQPAVSEEAPPSNPPPLPEPFKVASTMKCTACGAPYEPARALAPMAAGGMFSLSMCARSTACKCGSNSFSGTVGYDSPSPAQFTGQQMNDRWADGWKAGYKHGAWAARAQSSSKGDEGMQHE